MTIDQHPEDLIDRARHGPLAPAEQSALGHHLAICEACAALLAEEASLERELAPRARDEILDRRAVEAAMARMQRSPTAGRGQDGARWLRAAVAGMLLASAVTATAAIVGRKLASRGVVAAPGSPVVSPPPARSAPPPLAPAPEDVAEPAAPPAPIAVPPRPTLARPAITAADLFERAGKLRRAGQGEAAVAVYRRLQQTFPAARETEVSFALAGQILLEGGRPSDALAQFDRHPRTGGDVDEEALAGRAAALEQLHRTADAIAAWSSLLERHPGSIYAARARTRLTQLTERR